MCVDALRQEVREIVKGMQSTDQEVVEKAEHQLVMCVVSNRHFILSMLKHFLIGGEAHDVGPN